MREIVGVVGDAKQAALGADFDPVYYFLINSFLGALGLLFCGRRSCHARLNLLFGRWWWRLTLWFQSIAFGLGTASCHGGRASAVLMR